MPTAFQRVEAAIAETKKYAVARKFYESLKISERVPADRLEAYQASQLQQMLAHAGRTVPFYRDVLQRLRGSDGGFDLSRWPEIPIVSREIVASQWDDFQSYDLPKGHQSVLESATSGSEGIGLRMRKTRFDHTGVACASYRYADWFGYDWRVPLALIRAGFIRAADPNDPEDNRWGPPWIPAEQRSARYRLSINTPVEQQFDWLIGLGRVYLNTLPSNAMALAQVAARSARKPSLAAVLTVGERLSQDVRDEVKTHLGCRISDVYATAECGLIAVECPETGNYHIQSEISKVEVVRPDGSVCAPGEVGQLVATSLYNFAMPIIRYQFNDFLVLGEACTCGRTLPIIAKILGRDKGLFHFEDGSSLVPEFRTESFRQLAGTPYWQVAQTAVDRVDVLLKQPRPLSSDEQGKISDYICRSLNRRIDVKIETVEEFSRSKGGKFYPVVREF